VTAAAMRPLLKPLRRGGAAMGVLASGRDTPWRGWGGASAGLVGGGCRQQPAISGHGWVAHLSVGRGRDGAPTGGTSAQYRAAVKTNSSRFK
jgi:hypothetical protein